MSAAATEADTLIEVRDLKVHYPVYRGVVMRRQIGLARAVDGVSLAVRKGETLGVVGESGCGKSTLGRAILQLIRPTFGAVTYGGRDLTRLDARALREVHRDLQMIFQDPYSSLNPRMTVADMLGEPLRIHRLRQGAAAIRDRIAELLQLVGLDPKFAGRYPHEFSGGQRQRIGIARSLAVEPKFIVCDEPVSALDVSIQAQIVNLLKDLQRQLGLTYLFIAHGLHVVQHVSDRIAVMYLGSIVELASSEQVYERPLHPYTVSLLSAMPVPDPVLEKKRKRIVLRGDVPSALDPPAGCRFHTRCPIATDLCRTKEPALVENGDGHLVACHRADEVRDLLPDVRLDRASLQSRVRRAPSIQS